MLFRSSKEVANEADGRRLAGVASVSLEGEAQNSDVLHDVNVSQADHN